MHSLRGQLGSLFYMTTFFWLSLSAACSSVTESPLSETTKRILTMGGNVTRGKGTNPPSRYSIERVDLSRGVYLPVHGRVGEWTVLEESTIGRCAAGVTDKDTVVLKGLANLRDVNLCGSQISGKTLGYLNKDIERLNLAATDIDNKDLEILQEFRSLRELNLSGTAVTDDGLVMLEKLTKLEILYLDNTRVTSFGVAKLTKLSNLKSLYLRDTFVTREGLSSLHFISTTTDVVIDRQSSQGFIF